MVEWKAGDVAWGARWDYGRDPQVGFVEVRQVTKGGLLMKDRIPAFHHRARVDPTEAHKSEREALEALRRRLEVDLTTARDEVSRLERHLTQIENRLKS